jgi:predicted lipid-binding transport protein (Tim44 family)
MPRRSSSSSSTSRSATASRIAPPKQTNTNQTPARSGMAGGLMGSLMSGMAFGAGAEFFRQLFRNPTTGEYMMPLILSGLTAFGAHRFLLKPSPYKGLYTAAVFGGTFLVSKKALGSSDEYQH